MLCEECREREANVHRIRIVDNTVVQVHLCEKCAAAKGLETTVAVPAHPLAAVLHAAQDQAARASDAPRCSFCGTTPQAFRESGRLGCAHCYGAFAESLRELLRRVHGSTRHVGRRYTAPNPELIVRVESIADLRERLREAVEREDFEGAATLRDEIQALDVSPE